MSVLRGRSLRALISAEVISSFGSQMTFLALPWFVLVTTGSYARMGVVFAAELAPVALLGIPSGAVVARLGARRSMLVADFARAPLIAAIPLLHAAGALSFPLLIAIVALVGCFNAPYFGAQRVVLPELVGEDERAVGQANAFVEGGGRLASLVGPSAAGLLIVAVGATNVIYIDAATYVVSFLLVKLFVPHRPPPAQDGGSGGILAGLRFVLRDRLLGPLVASVIVANMAGPALVVALLALAYREYGHSARVAGVLVAATSAGAIVGVVATVRLLSRVAPLRLAAVAFVAGVTPLWLLTLDVPVAVLVLALAVFGAATPLINAPVHRCAHDANPRSLAPEGDGGGDHRGRPRRAARRCGRRPADPVDRRSNRPRARRRGHDAIGAGLRFGRAQPRARSGSHRADGRRLTRMPGARARFVPPLLRESREFRLFFAGQAVSLVGDQITMLALPLVGVLTLHASAAQMGYLTTAGSAAQSSLLAARRSMGRSARAAAPDDAGGRRRPRGAAVHASRSSTPSARSRSRSCTWSGFSPAR